MRNAAALLLVLFCACATSRFPDDTADVNRVLDQFHQAASAADEARYFGLMSPDFIFLGTDASERWDVPAFRAYAHPYFAQGKGWTFVPRDRHVVIEPGGDSAWFDELLDSTSYGVCRGTGVLRRVGGAWKVAQYNLSIPIPNDLAKEVVGRIKGR
jgi:hypothetical protein